MSARTVMFSVFSWMVWLMQQCTPHQSFIVGKRGKQLPKMIFCHFGSVTCLPAFQSAIRPAIRCLHWHDLVSVYTCPILCTNRRTIPCEICILGLYCFELISFWHRLQLLVTHILGKIDNNINCYLVQEIVHRIVVRFLSWIARVHGI
jgi:hypothetical protein